MIDRPCDSAPNADRAREIAMPGPARDYLRWYYDGHVWKSVYYRGVRTLKLISDLWNYQEIICERGVDWVIETGTRHGGSALFFADLLAARNAAGLVVTIDSQPDLHPSILAHPRVRPVLGDSVSSEVVDQVGKLLAGERGPAFVILDSDHRCAHVLSELRAYVPLMHPGDYLVVEDTIINGHPVRPNFGPGPAEALDRFLAEQPGLLARDRAREDKFGCTFAAGGYLVRT